MPPQQVVRKARYAGRCSRIEAFVAIADGGSFSAAASHLNLSQTAISHRIRKLEDSLATQLLLRTTRSVTLTPAGLALRPRARQLFEDLSNAVNAMRMEAGERRERLAIGCLPTIAMQCLPQVAARFLKEHPGVHIKIYDNAASEIADRVQADEAEFGITIVAANRWDLDLKPVAKEPFVLVCNRAMPLARHAALTWAQLQGLPLERISAETGNRILIDDALGARRESLVWFYEVQRVTTAVNFVRAAPAYAIVPQLAFDVVHADDLVAVPLRSPTVARAIGFITRKGLPPGRAAQHFMKLVARALRQRFVTAPQKR
ncbi:MAG: LysR family transcriptional regulator [Methylobacteriaceae bacterium]|nr:LysR family transcriptional regulator [Methylobacteriaceae bacterium]